MGLVTGSRILFAMEEAALPLLPSLASLAAFKCLPFNKYILLSNIICRFFLFWYLWAQKQWRARKDEKRRQNGGCFSLFSKYVSTRDIGTLFH